MVEVVVVVVAVMDNVIRALLEKDSENKIFWSIQFKRIEGLGEKLKYKNDKV